ncbi:hypothetical protein BP6252_13349 [Coleophoma cylindrospora]|uniref:Geranylgeranyl pyrophosphate synthetase n=1 Tax=Coleophoma cylindrospora TaxID=1849047 RepID=A0A3D8QAL1_9HELO|nr:hypothetical protein BP6252_13349 [Coleophoma cylindrospora]
MVPIAVSEISRLDLQELNAPAWLEAPHATPSIAVPGSPALWSMPRVSSRLNKDSGLVYIAQNAARHPESPLEPLFRALYVTHPSFDIRSTDVVTDRNNIRKLLSFIDPGSTRNGLEEFTINIEVIKNTAIFCRDEAKTMEYIAPHEFRGYGHEFEKEYTVNQISGSTGHHRIISYRFGGLKFIVRHETDGYVGTDTRMFSSKANGPSQDDLSSMLGELSLSASLADSHPNIVPTGSKMIVKEEGKAVPLESTLEIKTRVSHKPIEISEVAPQLWVSQTPKLVRAYHQKGTFQKPVVEDVAARIKTWEECKQNELRKLAALITKITSLAKECGGNAILKYTVEGDKLVLSKVERKDMLPKDLYLKWDDGNNPQKETGAQNNGMQKPETTEIGQTNISTMTSMEDDGKTKIRIGDVDHTIYVPKIPYLESFVRLQKVTRPQATEFVHEPIKLFDVALKGVESGFRQCFRCLPTDLSQYRNLFQTYKFLKVDILSHLSIDQIIANLKVGRSDYDPEERRRITGNKGLARDTAFQLLYLILHPESRDEKKDGIKIFNAVMFVVSHPGTFKYRTKRMIRVAYEEQFTVTLKQTARLDQWDKGETADYATDVTTEEETYIYFDSDYDSF